MRVLLLLLALANIAGCGVILHGTSQKIVCRTAPSGAVVRSPDGKECKTPCTVTLDRKKDETLTIERDGYQTVTLPLRSVMSKASLGYVLMPGGIVCWGIDLASGAAWRLVPGHIDVELTPVGTEGQ